MDASTRPRRAEAVPRRIRALRDGRAVVDSERVELWFTEDSTPFYAIPAEDVDISILADGDVTALPELPDSVARVSVRWEAAQAWFEEDEQVFVHPRDPYRRVDVFASGRAVRWEVAGQTLAQSRRALLLCETGMPGRWYLPPLDVDLSMLTPTGTSTGCPYKGEASYWSVTAAGQAYPDAIWSYQRPLPEMARIAGLLSADPDQVSIVVDGKPVPAGPFHPRWLNPTLWL